MLLIKTPFPLLPWFIFNGQQGLLCFASMIYHDGWKGNQTNLHFIDAFPIASAWQAECTTQFFLSPFLLLSTGCAITYQETILYYQDLDVVLQHLCLLPALYLKKTRTECATWIHTGSHEINPSSPWDFQWSPYGRIIFSHLTFSPSSQQEPGERFLKNEALRYILNRGRISDTYNSLPWWKSSAILKKKALSQLAHIIYVITIWLSLEDLGSNRFMPYGAENDTGKDWKSLSHRGLSWNCRYTILNRAGNVIFEGTTCMVQFSWIWWYQ